ncbi:MAG: DNA-3-methyladenine glycosylase family protein, partial [Aggregatilineales bacterium]
MNLFSEVGQLAATAPFDFSQSVRFINNFGPMHGEQNTDGDTITKAIRMHGHTAVFEACNQGTIDQPIVGYRLHSDQQLPAEVKQAILDQITFFLSLNDELRPFYAIADNDPHFAPIVRHLYGLHHVKFLTLCESACWSILTQRQTIPIAQKVKQALVEKYGSKLVVNGQTYWAFPEFDQLVPASVDDLFALTHNERRAQYLHGAIQKLKNADEEWLRTAPYDEAEAWLRQIKGIGEWSAAFILMRTLGRMERMLLDLKPFLKILPEVEGPIATMA